MYRFIVSALMILICAVPLSAQFTTASLGGEVRDVSGSTVPEAKVTVRNVDTGFTQTVSSDAAGAFLFSRLPVGSYELRVEKAGFTGYVPRPPAEQVAATAPGEGGLVADSAVLSPAGAAAPR